MKKLMALFAIAGILGTLGWQISQRISESKKPQMADITASPGTNARKPGGQFSKPAVAVEIADVRQQTIQDAGEYTGSLSPRSQFIVTSNVSGRLERLRVNIGDRVKQNQIIANVDDAIFQEQVQRAKADLDVANANLAEAESALLVAQREFERSQTLSKTKILSQSKLDAAEAAYHAAVARVNVAKATVVSRESALKTAELNLSYTIIKASWSDGVPTRIIAERFVDEGTLLKVNDEVVSVVDIQSITCVIYVIERDYFRVKQGQQAEITTDAFAGTVFEGKVARIAPILKETSRQAQIEIDIPNPDERLKPGMFVRVRLRFEQIENATIVPVAALVTRNEQQGVFAVDMQNDTAKFVPVTVGVTNKDIAQIVSPPLSGAVVTLGQHLLEDGASVTLPQPPQAQEPSSGEAKRQRQQPQE